MSFSYDATDAYSGRGRFANDAWKTDKRNCKMVIEEIKGKPYLFLKALRKIEMEEELRYDYGVKDAAWR